MNKLFKGFALALSMLSILPFFKVHDFYKGINGYAVMFYPLVGFLLGLILYGAFILLTPYLPPLHVSIIIFSLWVVLTGALHLDGFADTVDGLFVDKKRALEVMKDPHNGGMGITFSIVFLLLKASSLAALDAVYLLPVILMLSRLSAVLEIYLYPYISQNGMGSLAKAEFNRWQLFVALAYSFMVLVLFESYILMFVSLLVMFVLKSFFIKRYDGFTGDIYGFSIEMTELVLLNAVIVGLQ
ncbi:adenosylcobinamide-GDP ribazoletransferase [Sulfurimonas autotrophica]|uniref:Adenosylcobinamide-GDP ribazoletransferase n=1 Tax=Sulfurimonas autotrophica (strain ATCC BAA-671 / DSM 16294 / JCM 11897 / OK10) TaxID=563040 RepID=E0USS9_SULAO|nr:adenosylcobinamide-GDP ribazoletransferase [Sulfurimonas autotrophica]ADN08106.1 cobalamin 5'-phosphate synthase [Sulfurimonas autotrophica DSM 16294]